MHVVDIQNLLFTWGEGAISRRARVPPRLGNKLGGLLCLPIQRSSQTREGSQDSLPCLAAPTWPHPRSAAPNVSVHHASLPTSFVSPSSLRVCPQEITWRGGAHVESRLLDVSKLVLVLFWSSILIFNLIALGSWLTMLLERFHVSRVTEKFFELFQHKYASQGATRNQSFVSWAWNSP